MTSLYYTRKIDEEIKLQNLTVGDLLILEQLILKNFNFLLEFIPSISSISSSFGVKMFIDGSNSRFLVGEERTVLTSGIWYMNELAGVIAVQNFDKHNCNCEIGYWIGEEFQGKGIATRAVLCFCKELFQKLENSPIKCPIHKITFRVAQDNSKSIKICERIGCVQEGVLRQDEFYHGEFHNVVLYSILKSEMN